MVSFEENPGTKTVERLLEKVDDGSYVIPYFQRGFEWGPGMVCDLLESILQNYFTGLLLLWELDPVEAEKESWDPVWGAKLDRNPTMAILDGQQRLSSLYYALYNPKEKFPNRKTYYRFYLDMSKALNGDFDESVNYKYFSIYREIDDDLENLIKDGIMPISILSRRINNKQKYIDSQKFRTLIKKFLKGKGELDILESYDNIFQIIRGILNYQFIVYPLSHDRELRDICNIFARINKKGMTLSTFDLMNAFLYPKGVELRKDLWEKQTSDKLKQIDNKMNENILKIMSLIKQNYCSSKYLYNLIPNEQITRKNKEGKTYKDILVKNSKDFKDLWNEATYYAEKAREIIMNTGDGDFGSIKEEFMPNTTILVVLAAILWEYQKDTNEKEFKTKLRNWYWSAVLSEDYSGSSDSVIAKDYRDWINWIKNKDPIERINRVNQQFIDELDLINMRKGSGRYNAILSILALNNCKDFYTERTVGSVDYANDKINDHHIFPKKMKGLNDKIAVKFNEHKDTILNRTLLFDSTNFKIKNKKPSEYLKEMKNKYDSEEKVKRILKNHLINEKAYYYMKKDNFDKFIDQREREIKNHILKILKI
ncbi:MAG: GmrSD restriction endonuclease domain-containing protein [bacterium]